MSVIEPGKEQRGEGGESSPISTRDSLREVSSLGRHTRKLGSGPLPTRIGREVEVLEAGLLMHTYLRSPELCGRAGKIGVIDQRCLLQLQEGRRRTLGLQFPS